MKRAAGSHPLQSAFREKAAELAAKYGLAGMKSVGDEDEDGEEGEEEEEGEEGEGEEEEDSEGEEESGAGEGEDEEEEEGGEAEEEEEEEGDEYEQELKSLLQERVEPRERPSTSQAAAAAAAAAGAAGQVKRSLMPGKGELEGPADVPFTIPVPEKYERWVPSAGSRAGPVRRRGALVAGWLQAQLSP